MKKETPIQKECLKLLETYEKMGEPVIASRTNTGKIKSAYGGWVHLCPTGWPDITACICGQFVGIEVKKVDTDQSDVQSNMEKRIRKAGGDYVVIRSPKELNGYLKRKMKEGGGK